MTYNKLKESILDKSVNKYLDVGKHGLQETIHLLRYTTTVIKVFGPHFKLTVWIKTTIVFEFLNGVRNPNDNKITLANFKKSFRLLTWSLV